MPNIASHIAITNRAVPYATSEVVFGSIAPDFAGMHRDFNGDKNFRLEHFELKPAIELGHQIHKQTDAVFKGMIDNRQLIGQLAEDLRTDDELSRGAVFALSDVGNDILLDGEVIKDSYVASKFELIGSLVLKGALRIRADLSSSPVEAVAVDYFKRGLPTRYQDPELVAQLLYKRLQKRGNPDLAFSEPKIELVAEAFDRHISRLKTVAGKLIDQAVEIIAPEPT